MPSGAGSRVRRLAVGDLTFSVFGGNEPGAASLAPSAPTAEPPRVRYVLLHGIGLSHRYFAQLHDDLARAAEVRSIDLPGFGSAPKPLAAPDVPTMAAALGAVLDALGGPPNVLIGHSMGAQWAAELARQRPDLVAAVVLIGPVVDRAHRSLRAQLVALLIDACAEPPRVNALACASYLRCGPRTFLRQAVRMRRYRIETAVAQLGVPVLVMRGARDRVAGPRWVHELVRSAPRGALVTVPGGAHAVHASAPREVADAVRAFATENGLTGTGSAADPRGAAGEVARRPRETVQSAYDRCERRRPLRDDERARGSQLE
ncbi:alpha/beta fold hydrolase [Leucobacter chromiiresistens]